MPTTTVVTVKSSGGDYTSLSAAEAGEQADLVTADVQMDIECYSFADTTAVTFDGWTTDATRYIRVYTPTAERHAGVWNTSKYRLSINAEFSRPLIVSEDFVRVEGLQIEQTHANGVSPIRVVGTADAASSDVRFDATIVRSASARTNVDTGSNIALASGKTTIRNSVIYDAGASCIYSSFVTNSPTVDLDNVTLAAGTTYGLNHTNGTATLRNVYSGGNGTDDFNGTITRTTCMHSSATSFTGSTGSTAYDTNNFTNVTSGSEDLHLPTGSALLDAGTDLSGDFTTDIDGDTRTRWSVGADDGPAAGGGATPKRLTLLGVG